ncbi:MAG: Bax inhibitor-1/YccA family protein [Anaerolineales bacterium]
MTFDIRTTTPTFVSEGQLADALGAAMRRVYLWMAIGLLVTTVVAAVVANTGLVLLIAANPIVFIGLIVGELAMVIAVSAAINRVSPATALLLFFAYSALNGATLAVIFLVYTLGSIALTFFASAALFGAMSIIGYTTKMDLSRFGAFLLMGLIGIIIASVVNMFLASTALEWIITFVGIFVFLGLAVYHTQRIRVNTLAALQAGDDQAAARVGIIGALSLYLDFINLFLMLLRLMGRRR